MKQGQPEPERRMKGRTFILILVIGTIVGVGLVGGSIYLNAAPTGTSSLTGRLFVSSDGQLTAVSQGSGGFAVYNVSLAAVSGTGTMNLTLLSSGADIVQQHQFHVSELKVSPNNLTMVLSSANVNLGWINNGTTWKSLNESYIGAGGPAAPAGQVRGLISPSDFPGVPQGYYVLLSVTITSQPANNIPFALAPVGPESRQTNS